jgi:hypothetical protein
MNRGKLALEAACEPPASLIEVLARHKVEIIALLDPVARINGAAFNVIEDDNDADAEAERAAIIEFDGGVPRLWAEALAKLCRRRRPDSVTSREWDQLRDDFAHFCECWALQAEALGWRPRDLLRWAPCCPYTHLGLAWKFEGRPVVEVRQDAIVIERAQPSLRAMLFGPRATLTRRWLI